MRHLSSPFKIWPWKYVYAGSKVATWLNLHANLVFTAILLDYCLFGWL